MTCAPSWVSPRAIVGSARELAGIQHALAGSAPASQRAAKAATRPAALASSGVRSTGQPRWRSTCAVAWPTAAMRTPCGASGSRSTTAATAWRLANTIQRMSDPRHPAPAQRRQDPAGPTLTAGHSSTCRPSSRSSRLSGPSAPLVPRHDHRPLHRRRALMGSCRGGARARSAIRRAGAAREQLVGDARAEGAAASTESVARACRACRESADPSSAHTCAASVSVLPLRVASAPSGTWQPPSMRAQQRALGLRRDARRGIIERAQPLERRRIPGAGAHAR